jgi:serine/threonine protein kinase
VQHDHIVAIDDHGTWDGYAWYAQADQYGLPLSEVLPKRKLSIIEVLQVGHQACVALSHTHKLGTLHNNICPENLFVTEDGTCRLARFAVEQRTGAFNAALNTTETDPFSAPERIHGNVDERSDVCSLGMTLAAACGLSLNPPVSRIRPLLGLFSKAEFNRESKLRVLLSKAAHRSPQQRFRNAEEFGTALKRLAESS